MRFVLIAIVAVNLVGCASAQKLNELSIGMTKPEVLKKMGSPDRTEAAENEEYLVYVLPEHAGEMFKDPYIVTLKDGHVSSWGAVPRSAQAMPMPAFQPVTIAPVQYHPTQQNKGFNCTSNRVGDQTYTNCR